MKQLNKMEGAIDSEYNPFAPQNVLRSPSPSLNWIFGQGSGLPFGYSAIFYGPPKGGKSLSSYLSVCCTLSAFPVSGRTMTMFQKIESSFSMTVLSGEYRERVFGDLIPVQTNKP